MSVEDPECENSSQHEFRVISVNLDVREIAWLDDLQTRLRRRGLMKATRSEIVRVAVFHLRHQLHSCTDGDLVQQFLNGLVGAVFNPERPMR